MELESSYQLLSVLRDDGICTYSAIEIASGQPMQVHLFARSDSETDRALYKALRALPVSRRRELLEMGMEGDKPYIVTDKLPENTTAREWLTKLAGAVPARPSGPVMLAGSWKTGTPIPEELVKACSTSLPPKPPQPKPETLGPDYTRVMRLPDSLSAIQPVEPASAKAAVPPLPPQPVAKEPSPETTAATESASQAQQQKLEHGSSGEDEFDRIFLRSSPPDSVPEFPRSQADEFTGTPIGSMPPLGNEAPEDQPVIAPQRSVPRAKEPGEFTRMFLAVRPAEPAAPATPPEIPVTEPNPQEPGEFTRMFIGTQPPAAVQPPVPSSEPGAFTEAFVAPQPIPSRPSASQIQPIPPQAGSNKPGEFTASFMPAQPTQTQMALSSTPLPVPVSNPAQPIASEVAPNQPGEFTSKFLKAKPSESVWPAVPPQPPPSPADDVTRIFQAVQFSPAQTAITPPAKPQQPLPPQTPPVQLSMEEKTRLFQAVGPSGQPSTPPQTPSEARVKDPGEFTRMFPPVRPDTPAAAPTASHEDTGEFTRFFQSPMHPSPEGNQRFTPGIQPAPAVTRPPAQPGEFTQMFGNPSRPAMPPMQPLGAAGSATGAFSIPQASAPGPARKGSEPGEFTRMMSASAAPTLGQPPAQPTAQPAVDPGPKSRLPLYIAGVAVLLAVIVIVLFFLLR